MVNLKLLLGEINILKEQQKKGVDAAYHRLKGIRETVRAVNNYQNNDLELDVLEENVVFNEILTELELDR